MDVDRTGSGPIPAHPGNQAQSTRAGRKNDAHDSASAASPPSLPSPPPALPQPAGDERGHRSRRIQVGRPRLLGLISSPPPHHPALFARVGVDTEAAPPRRIESDIGSGSSSSFEVRVSSLRSLRPCPILLVLHDLCVSVMNQARILLSGLDAPPMCVGLWY